MASVNPCNITITYVLGNEAEKYELMYLIYTSLLSRKFPRKWTIIHANQNLFGPNLRRIINRPVFVCLNVKLVSHWGDPAWAVGDLHSCIFAGSIN